MSLNEIIYVRTDNIPISNKFEIINTFDCDFHIVIYYLEDHKCKIIIRRLDDGNNGWTFDLKIKIYNLEINDNNTFEILSIGSSLNNFKIVHSYPNIKLYKIIFNDQLIPKKIIQTTYNKNIVNVQHLNSIYTFIELNPEYEYQLFDDDECRLFIKNNFDERTLIGYDMLIAGAFKSDLFRYCYLYIHGGCYFDCKSILRVPIREIVNSEDKFILCKDIGIGYYNAIILSIKLNQHLLNVINECINNIYNFSKKYNFKDINFNSGDNILSLTGPVLVYNVLYQYINKINVLKYIHKSNKNKKYEYQKLIVEYEGKEIITKNYSGYEMNNSHYSKLWYNKEILYSNTYNNERYKFYQFNYHVKDLFKFHILSEKSIIIERLDDNCGWGNILKIKIIDEVLNKEIKIDVGNSNNNFKQININEDENNYGNNDFIFDFKNILESFTIKNDNDKYDLICNKEKDVYKLIIIKTNDNNGWNNNFSIELLINNNGKTVLNTIHVKPSKYNVSIIYFS
jgi:mannosyltransferase OCH1-like enzyme